MLRQQTHFRRLFSGLLSLLLVLPVMVVLPVWMGHGSMAHAAATCLLSNADFESAQLAPWYLQVDTNSGADARLSIDAGYHSPQAAQIDIAQRGEQDWHVQRVQVFDSDKLVLERDTDTNGWASLPVAPGQYRICEVIAPGWHNTSPGEAGCYWLTLRAGDMPEMVFENIDH